MFHDSEHVFQQNYVRSKIRKRKKRKIGKRKTKKKEKGRKKHTEKRRKKGHLKETTFSVANPIFSAPRREDTREDTFAL